MPHVVSKGGTHCHLLGIKPNSGLLVLSSCTACFYYPVLSRCWVKPSVIPFQLFLSYTLSFCGQIPAVKLNTILSNQKTLSEGLQTVSSGLLAVRSRPSPCWRHVVFHAHLKELSAHVEGARHCQLSAGAARIVQAKHRASCQVAIGASAGTGRVFSQ